MTPNAQQEAKKALDGAGNLSREKHLLVEARFYETSRNWGKAIEAYQTLFSFFPDNLEYGLQLANAETGGGRGKDALKSLAALDSLGCRQRTTRELTWPDRTPLRRSATTNSGETRQSVAAQKAGKQGAKLLVARARDSECRASGESWRKRKSQECLRRSEADLRCRGRPRRFGADPARHG